MSNPSPAPAVTCEGFYPTNRDAQSQGSHETSGSAKSCTQHVGGSTFGFCSCSDSVPRFVNLGSICVFNADVITFMLDASARINRNVVRLKSNLN